mmetsp:Transcript_2002/g.7134  ORF Transcript_2002/g.7134 Transcript_2002/m.7134 type:complete len:129 (-) Transcript_2002:272-658(-)
MMADAAQKYSLCGSRNKSPTASMAMLRGLPGELRFKRGEMAKPFEEAAFANALGAVDVVQTTNGWHVLLVNSRTGELPPPGAAAGADAAGGAKREPSPAAPSPDAELRRPKPKKKRDKPAGLGSKEAP